MVIEKSVYAYDKFDSYTEFHFADYLDVLLKKVSAEKKPFWVRNQRNVFLNMAQKILSRFLLFKEDQFYIVETKGEVFADHKKNALLKRLEQIPGDEHTSGYKGLLVFSNQMDKMGYNYWDFENSSAQAESAFANAAIKSNLIVRCSNWKTGL